MLPTLQQWLGVNERSIPASWKAVSSKEDLYRQLFLPWHKGIAGVDWCMHNGKIVHPMVQFYFCNSWIYSVPLIGVWLLSREARSRPLLRFLFTLICKCFGQKWHFTSADSVLNFYQIFSKLSNSQAGSRDGAVVRSLASQQCGLGSIPGTRRHMSVEFVLGSRLCSERFFSGYFGFPLSSKKKNSKFQFRFGHS